MSSLPNTVDNDWSGVGQGQAVIARVHVQQMVAAMVNRVSGRLDAMGAPSK